MITPSVARRGESCNLSSRHFLKLNHTKATQGESAITSSKIRIAGIRTSSLKAGLPVRLPPCCIPVTWCRQCPQALTHLPKGLIMRRLALLTILLLTILARPCSAAPPDKETQRTLRETATVQFVDTPLKDALAQLAESHNVTIRLHEEAITDVGIPTDEPVNLFINGITLRSVLNLVLEDLGLTATPHANGGLEVTTQEIADERMDTRRYDLRPILSHMNVNAEAIRQAILTQTRHCQWTELDGLGGTIKVDETSVVVYQTNRAHNEIAHLLAQITRLVNPQQAPPLSPEEVSERALRRKMEQDVEVEFVDTSLTDAIDQLARLTDIPFQIDAAALHDSGIPTDEPVNLPKQKAPMDEILGKILPPLDLNWFIADQFVKVTNQEIAEETNRSEVFNVRRKIQQLGGAQPLIDQIQELEGARTWESIDGIGGTLQVLDHVLIINHHRVARETIAEFLEK